MHIAHLVTRLLRAGSEENTAATCRWQVNAGHKVTLIHGADADPWWYDNPMPGVDLVAVPDMVHPVRPLADLRAIGALRRVYRDLQPDVIHTHQSKAGILGRLAAEAAPDAVVAHGIHIVPFNGVSTFRRAAYLKAEWIAARYTDVFIGVSEAVCRTYLDAGIARPGAIHCVRSGMDLDRFRKPHAPDDWRDLLQVSTGGMRPLVVVMLAAFEPRKRHIPFLRAFARIAATLPETKLLLAGAGPQEARIRGEVARLGLSDCVVFCGHRPDPEALLALADVSVLTSEREGLPRVVVQSVAAGCPVVINDLPGLGEVLRDGVNGVIAAPDDIDGAVAGLAGLLTCPATLQRLRNGARSTDVSAWDLDRIGARTTALYDVADRVMQPLVA